MNLQRFLFIWIVLLFSIQANAQNSAECIDDATISIQGGGSGGDACIGDGQANLIRFKTNTLATPFGYVVVDENDLILYISTGNIIDFENFQNGTLRIYAFSFIGQITAQVGDNLFDAELASICYALTTNFVTITSATPQGGTVSTSDGASSQNLCVGDGTADVVNFVTTSTEGNYVYLITDENNNILAISEDGSFDFESSPEGICRVWGLAYLGDLLAEIGQDAATAQLATLCFELSENFVEIIRSNPDGGTVALTNGDTEIIVCDGANSPSTLSFSNQTSSQAPYTFVLTDENNIIVAILDGNSLNFADLPNGNSRVHGLSFTGTLTANVGDDATVADLSDDCFDLSDNFVTIVKQDLDAGSVSLSTGETEALACVGDGVADEFTIVTSSTTTETYVYVITDDNNLILDISEDGIVDFDNAPIGVCRVWGLVLSGTLNTEIGADAASFVFSDECYKLSDNFVTITRKSVDGGSISLNDGTNAVDFCVGDGIADVADYNVSSSEGESYLFIITDDANNILTTTTETNFDFENAEGGTCRIWGLAYSGTFTGMPGDNAATVALSDECFALSDNFIEIDRTFVDGGTVAIDGGATSAVVCSNDPINGTLLFEFNTTAFNADYTFVVTDENNNILNFLAGSLVNFTTVTAGTYRLYGVSYTGMLIAQINDVATEVPLSSDCYELSSNFVEVRKEDVEGGTVSMPDGGVQTFTCPGDGNPDVVMFTNTGSSTGGYTYVITDAANNILQLVDASEFDFDGAPQGTCRVWGLAYTGSLTAMAGENTDTVAFSDECFDLSDSFIEVVREVPNGGTVATPAGDTLIYVCPGDGLADLVEFDSTGTSSGAYTYVITDENDVILSIPTGDSNDFESAPTGICHVWGLAYTGTLTAMVGDTINLATLSDDCYGLSDNYIEVIRELPSGGTVALANGETSVRICPLDGNPDIVSFDSTGVLAPNFTYIVTDTNNVILTIIDGDEFDFDSAPEGICRVWGVAYTGDLTAMVDDTASIANLATGCFALSDNFVEVIREIPEGGTISTVEGETEISICVGDGFADLISMVTTNASGGNYSYIVTDTMGFLIGVLEQDSFDFDNALGADCRIYGLAYTGIITPFPGDNIFEVPLSSDCYDLSDNFISLTKIGVDGGLVFTDFGTDTLYVCADDDVDDIIAFNNSSIANEASYQYVLTTPNNLVLAFVPGNEINFENTGFAQLRVWGISYTGNLTLALGNILTDVALSDECYVLSENHLTVFRDMPEAGVITAEEGQTDFTVCIGADDGVIEVSTTSTSNSGYVLILTTINNEVLNIYEGNEVDFNVLDPRIYRIYGLSYTGSLLVVPGDILTEVELASSCYELTESFIRIIRSQPVDGGEISLQDGSTILYTCPGDDEADLAVLLTTSLDTGYQYVITDTFNQVLIPDVNGSVIDFDAAAPGVCRIYGISYNGNYLVGFGDDVTQDELSDNCYVTSANYVTIVRQTPEGGKITSDMGESVELIVNDGVADVLTFTSVDAALSPYVYVITDELDIILGFVDGNTHDFENAGVGICHVWGLSYTGEIIAEVGDTLLSTDLSDDCFDLSDEPVTIKRSEGFNDTDTELRGAPETNQGTVAQMFVRLSPNPTRDMLQVNYTLTESASNVQLLLINSQGQIISRYQKAGVKGDNQESLDVNQLTPGFYILRVSTDDSFGQERFIKR
ncbi:MAG: hypothetical protein DHS20C18_44630 [Saprospiraceae bacterium]|nr:MAG: hypothetical protein DHS20C18_44630 [Saprospiraceae bacterium]